MGMSLPLLVSKAGGASRRHSIFIRWLMATVLVLSPQVVLAQRPKAFTPTATNYLVERLPRGYSELTPTRAPDIGVSSVSRINLMIRISASTGDTRLAGRAAALIEALPRKETDPELIRARAFLAQHRHDFAASQQLLSRLIAMDPRDANARLSRAQASLVQGKIRQARSDCAVLALGIDHARGLLCIGSLKLRTGDFSTARMLIDQWLNQPSKSDEDLRYALTMRAETAWRSGSNDAATWYRRALSAAPADTRTLLSYTRYLRSAGQASEVAGVLEGIPETDGLQLQRALAAHTIKGGDASMLANAQGRRYALAREAGNQPELRDEAEYLLVLRNDPEAALVAAILNFRDQRDYEDVDILVRSANAANRPDALVALHEWAKSEQLTLPEIQ